MSFKVGDKVRLKKNPEYRKEETIYIKPDRIYTIRKTWNRSIDTVCFFEDKAEGEYDRNLEKAIEFKRKTIYNKLP